MIKTVLKELIIVLLLILAILLVLGIFLYDYIPMNKVVPKIEQYEAPNNIKEELEETIDDTENTMTPIVYEINDSDLKLYEKAKDYQKGKVNPFASTSDNTVNTNSNNTINTQNGSTTNNNASNNTNKITNTSSQQTYLPNTGTK